MTVSGKHWPYILFSIPFAAVLLGIVMIAITVIHPDDIVVDDYYRDGMAINRQLDQDQRAVDLGLSLRLVSISDQSLAFDIEGAFESELLLKLYHVTDEALDRELVLVHESGYTYAAADEGLQLLGSAGIWYLQVESTERNWRLRSRIHTPLTELSIVPEEVR